MSTDTSFLSPEQVYYGVIDSCGRCMGISRRSDGSQDSVLLEWRSSVPVNFKAFILKALENIPTDDDMNRPEEVRTLKFKGIFKVDRQSPSALVYECAQRPLNLREVLLTIEKPSAKDRRILGSIIATQIRSLSVHFDFQHAGLRIESFVFFGDHKKPDLFNPYLLDWGRPSSTSIYRHPKHEAGKYLWFYDVWSLMIVLSEIAEWKPVDGTFQDASEVWRKQLQRMKELTSPYWKGEWTAKIMQYGFGFLEKDNSTLEKLSRKDIKRFFDKLCSLFQEP
jgi:hypothetical protein